MTDQLTSHELAARCDGWQAAERQELLATGAPAGRVTWLPRGVITRDLLSRERDAALLRGGWTAHGEGATCTVEPDALAETIRQGLARLRRLARELEPLQTRNLRPWRTPPSPVAEALREAAGSAEPEGAEVHPGLRLYTTDPAGCDHAVGTLTISPAGTGHRQVVLAPWPSLADRCATLLARGRGHLPCHLAPLQVSVLPVSDAQAPAARQLLQALRAVGARTELWPATERLARRIRNLHRLAVPYACLLGPREAATGHLTLRHTATGTEAPHPIEKAPNLLARTLIKPEFIEKSSSAGELPL